MTTRLTIVSTKGGVGKTTLTANLGALLADLGYRVLLIDADIQPTLSSYFQLTDHTPAGLVEILQVGRLDNAISRTTSGCDLIVSNDAENTLPDWILHTPDGRFRLKRILRSLNHYAFILIDTQGAAGPLQDMAVLTADVLLSPIPPDVLSAREFSRGTLAMIERLSHREDMGFPLGNLYGLIYRLDRTVDARLTAESIRRLSYGPSQGRIQILSTVVPATLAYREAAAKRLPVHRFESTRKGPTPSGLESMLALARELPLGIDAVELPVPVPAG
jgi:chromosome partitioning related protein ParA